MPDDARTRPPRTIDATIDQTTGDPPATQGASPASASSSMSPSSPAPSATPSPAYVLASAVPPAGATVPAPPDPSPAYVLASGAASSAAPSAAPAPVPAAVAAPARAPATTPEQDAAAVQAAALAASNGKLSEQCFFFAFAVAVTLYAQQPILWGAVGFASAYAYVCMRTAASMGGRPEDAANLRLLMILLVFTSISMRTAQAVWMPMLYGFVCLLLINAAANIETVAQGRLKKTPRAHRASRSAGGTTPRT